MAIGLEQTIVIEIEDSDRSGPEEMPLEDVIIVPPRVPMNMADPHAHGHNPYLEGVNRTEWHDEYNGLCPGCARCSGD